MSSSFLRVQETFCSKKPGDDKFMFKDILGVIVVVGKASNWFGQLLMSFYDKNLLGSVLNLSIGLSRFLCSCVNKIDFQKQARE